MKRLRTEPFWSKLTIGLEKGYSQEPIDKTDVIKSVQEYQNRLIRDEGIYLSAKVSECEIVLSGQVEPHLTLSFINYPKFPLPISKLKKLIEQLGEDLMHKFYQNRIVILYDDETVMLDKSDEIDNRIK